ncbi:MAG: VOC family protein [Nocardioides sp.]|uniref:VOC family protein n=1 Tax=Nocardioides sp. TaxID=35761 RepID=UPI003263A4C5
MALTIQSVIVDCHDPSALAAFWEAALGWRRTYEKADEVILEPPEHSLQDGVPEGNEFCVLEPFNEAQLDLLAETRAARTASPATT